jgi:hypothetical protein
MSENDSYNSGYSDGLTGTPSSEGGINYQLGAMAGKQARGRNDGPAGAGIGILALSFALCWIYPMVGMSVGAVAVVIFLGIETFHRYVTIALLGLVVVAWFFGFKLERRAARFKVYRIFRDCVRLLVGVIPWVGILVTSGREAPSGAALAGYPFIYLFLFWLMKKADRVMGFNG